MFALVFTSHQKTRVLRGFPVNKSSMATRQLTLFSVWSPPDKKKGIRKKGKKRKKKFVDLHDERIKYFGHFNV